MKLYQYAGIIVSAGLIVGSVIFNGCTNNVEATPVESLSEEALTDEYIKALPYEELAAEEMDGLVFMREEEKLARDVYLVLYTKWNQRVFSNISQSEQTHMDAMKSLLDKYNLQDPVTSDSIGVFKNEVLQELYYGLINQGSISVIEALKVGALIEEIDIVDIQNELDMHADNQDVVTVYNNLLKGSRNHLRAFVKNLSKQGVTYNPQKLSEEEFLTIIESSWERGRL